MNHNHSRYQARLDFINGIDGLLKTTFDLPANTQVEPIAYDPESPFKYNNFVYRISLPSPLDKENSTCQKLPGCVAIPPGTSALILRLTNPDATSMGSPNRVENEVAIMTLAAAALNPNFEPHVVPRVYGWAGTRSNKGEPQQGWILQEFMPGIPLDEELDKMNLEGKKEIFTQIAKLLKGLQDFPLPASITKFGGLTFDNENNIISAQMTTTDDTGPWPSYEAAFEARLKQALIKSDENPYIRGWRENGRLGSPGEKAIIHADLTPNNLLFDITSGRITGLIDYDFSGFGGKFAGWPGIEARDARALRKAKLYGFPDPLPGDRQDGKGVQWKVAKIWENTLQNEGCKRPMTISGIEVVADVDALLGTILPWRVTNSDILRRQTDGVIRNCRDENEKILIEILEHLGF
ncbi:hypothetical protein N7461_009514 [Penicillium sp. DV-2018c]|nr:hypothetical protein N7461_009514 [Penicillium sp. DV-2018c]